MMVPSRIPLAGVVSLGCSKNLVDAEYLVGGLGAGGWRLVPDRERADLLLVNTCAFIGPAVEESHEAIAEAVLWKGRRRGRTVVVAGCMVNRFAGELAARYPDVDLFLSPKQIPRLGEWLALARPRPRRLGNPGRAFLPGDGLERSLTTGPWAYLKISDGCSNCCHYCLIPAIRGPHASRTRAAVLDEARALVDAGTREINLVGQDITRFGESRRGGGLPGLVRAIAALPGEFRVRLLYLHPERVDDAIIDLFAATPKLCAYLDIPIQHASTRILARMNRRYGRRDLARLFATLRERLPGIALRTTVMVGYPGEGRREFAELLAFLRAHPCENLGAFVFSPQPGTKAAGMAGAAPREEAEERYHQVMTLQASLASDLWAQRVGTVTEALLLAPEPGRPTIWSARTPWQAPEVDGRICVHGRGEPGAWVPVRVTGSSAYDLEGKIL
ncbi:MAG TPA: MiaB/RimO family radical SAM methylthiotransferase [Candidatus Methanoperedens sp.]|nr:MiaB/RimO family radical SAM methylthiotransferase [Candidatus Methanoperedens sp.]